MSPRAPRPRPDELDALIEKVDLEDLRVIVAKAAECHEDVARAVRLAATRGSGDLSQLKAEIDRGLRTSRYLGYQESRGWAMQARPIVAAISEALGSSLTAELVALIERAIGHVVKVILKADDSDGLIGDLARELLDLHARACDAGTADPLKLARWMVRFRFDDQDFFEVDPVRYADALGELGLAAYRREVTQRVEAGGGDSFAATYAQERLAVLDGDTEALVGLLGGDLSRPYQFIRVAEAMAELGRDDDVLSWATRGIAETSGWQVAQLYDLAAGVHTRRREDQEVLRLRRNSTSGCSRHRRTASCALQPRSAGCGRPSAQRPGRCWRNTTSAGWSTCCSPTASRRPRGRSPELIRSGIQGRSDGCAWPRPERRLHRATRSMSTYAWLTSSSRRPERRHTCERWRS
ncbi:MAG: hypothetical protein M0014_01850 [Actinomycetota bacterium]|nr:hypothetical protein [Actinomycetota bacterium]